MVSSLEQAPPFWATCKWAKAPSSARVPSSLKVCLYLYTTSLSPSLLFIKRIHFANTIFILDPFLPSLPSPPFPPQTLDPTAWRWEYSFACCIITSLDFFSDSVPPSLCSSLPSFLTRHWTQQRGCRSTRQGSGTNDGPGPRTKHAAGRCHCDGRG